MMPLAGVTAIMFSSPIFTTLASIYFLHERVGAARWAALLIGFLGVLVIAAPGADSFQIGALFALGNAILFGTVVVGVRGMTATESTGTLIMYQLSLLTIVYARDASVRLRHADRDRCIDHDRERARQRRRAVFAGRARSIFRRHRRSCRSSIFSSSGRCCSASRSGATCRPSLC